MNIHAIRTRVSQEEVDYILLKNILSDFSYPRNKINSFLRTKELIRVKKGLYIFGPSAARVPYHREVLANLIYGPSAISLEYALGFYGFIPERVEIITSVTNKRNKYFSTPIGEFSYRYLNSHKYSVGITQVELDKQHRILIATPEKAMADVLLFSCNNKLKNYRDLTTYLFENLRIDEANLRQLDLKLLYEIAEVYQHDNITLLTRYLNQ
jgi:predicted transcriptional regulator of viral defense system